MSELSESPQPAPQTASSAESHQPERALELTSGAQRAAGRAALAAAALAISKLALFLMSGSMLVALSAWDSALDVLVSSVNRRVISFARAEPDDEHPYGHGKAESMAALAQGALILGGAFMIALSSAQSVWQAWRGASQPPLEYAWELVGFFAFAGALSQVITAGLRRAAKEHHSPALAADAEHYQTDVISNVASAVSIAVISLTELSWLDPLLAVGFALLIARGGLGLVREAVDELLDHELSESEKLEAINLIKGCSPLIIDLHNLLCRRSGHRRFFDFHVTLPSSLSFQEAHDITDAIEAALSERFDADVVVHADPDSPSRMNTQAERAEVAHA